LSQQTEAADGGVLRQLVAEIAALRAALDEVREILRGASKSHYTVDEVAARFGRAPYTIRSWIRDGRIRAERLTGTGPRGRLLVPRSELDKLVAQGRGARVSLYDRVEGAPLLTMNLHGEIVRKVWHTAQRTPGSSRARTLNIAARQ
jgi:excisionase family DNA binding protein